MTAKEVLELNMGINITGVLRRMRLLLLLVR